MIGALMPTTATSGSTATVGAAIADSVTGAGFELLIVQQGGKAPSVRAVSSCCPCIPAIIGQSGRHCMEAMELVESGTQSASEPKGARSAISTKLAETTLYQIRIGVFYASSKRWAMTQATATP